MDAEEQSPPDQLSPLDRALLAEATLRTNLAAHEMRSAQNALAVARAAQNELTARITRDYLLAEGDSVNPDSGAISRTRTAAK